MAQETDRVEIEKFATTVDIPSMKTIQTKEEIEAAAAMSSACCGGFPWGLVAIVVIVVLVIILIWLGLRYYELHNILARPTLKAAIPRSRSVYLPPQPQAPAPVKVAHVSVPTPLPTIPEETAGTEETAETSTEPTLEQLEEMRKRVEEMQQETAKEVQE